MALLRNITWRRLGRRFTAGVTLLAYLVAMCGVPMPSLAAPRSHGAFPCQGLLCGCMTVEQCQSCGCHTPDELANWENNNPPPPVVEKPTPAPSCCCSTGEVSPAACPHCTPKPPKPSCAEPSISDLPRKGSPGCAPVKPTGSCCPSPDSQDKDGVRWGLVSAWRCHGLTLHWIANGAAEAARPPVAWAPSLAPAGWLAQTLTTSARISFIPPDPPPRS
jgi:hypothetical protein